MPNFSVLACKRKSPFWERGGRAEGSDGVCVTRTNLAKIPLLYGGVLVAAAPRSAGVVEMGARAAGVVE